MARNTSVVLSDHFQQFIEQQVESGRYGSASEVVRAGLRMLETYEERVRNLDAALAEGEASGNFHTIDTEAFLSRRTSEQ
jgi:antitoxin ParD1/3/4